MKTPKKIADDIMEAILCRLSKQDQVNMGLVEDYLEHCLHSVTTIIKYNLDKNSERKYMDTEIEDMEYRLEELQQEIQNIEKVLNEKRAEQTRKMVRSA